MRKPNKEFEAAREFLYKVLTDNGPDLNLRCLAGTTLVRKLMKLGLLNGEPSYDKVYDWLLINAYFSYRGDTLRASADKCF